MDKKQRIWNLYVPNATNGYWYFIFYVYFEQISTQRVVVRWTETSIGSGSFKLSHYGVCWGCLFEAYQRIERLAEQHAYDWNIIDARCG